MKKLSEFEGDAGIDLVADLMPYIYEIVSNPETAKARSENILLFAQALLKNNKPAVKGILALLNETPVEEYKISAASILVDTLTMLNDDALMALFGLQSKKTACSGSVSENTKAPEK